MYCSCESSDISQKSCTKEQQLNFSAYQDNSVDSVKKSTNFIRKTVLQIKSYQLIPRWKKLSQ